MELHLHPFDLKLQETFTIAHDSRKSQETMIIEIRDGDISGFGEATATKYFEMDMSRIKKDIERARSLVESYNYSTPEDYWVDLKKSIPNNTFSLSAIDVAIHDLYAKNNRFSLRRKWYPGKETFPLSNYTIGLDDIDAMIRKLKSYPWPLYKIKLGTEDDLAIIKELRRQTDSTFRVDANGAWTVEQTIAFARQMKPLGVEFIEQPLSERDWYGMKWLFKNSPLPLIADESIKVEDDVKKCVDHFHGINIKLMKCGGFTPAIRMLKQAENLGLKKMVGCMTESSVGISAVSQLAPGLDFIDMDGAELLCEDIANGPIFSNQMVSLPEGQGIGVDAID